MKFFYLLLIAIIFSTACSNNSNNQDAWDKQNLREVEAGDQRVTNAQNYAQAALPQLTQIFNSRKDSLNFDFYIKSKFKDDKSDQVEHMWSRILEISEVEFIVRLDNEPYYLKNVAYQDTIKLRKSEIEDFMVYENNVVILGNFFEQEFAE